MDESKLNGIRRAALNEVDRSQKAGRWLLVAAAVVEAGGLILFLVLMDFSNRLHWLIFIAAGLVYGTLALTLFSLGEDLKASFQRVLRAIDELSVSQEPESG